MPPSIDRISGLPDDVICHILSFLPTKTSASTDVLARRWRLLWTHVQNLYFEGDLYLPRISKHKTPDSDLITRVIVLHQAKTINSFRLSDVNCTEFQLATWITHAVNRGVRNLCVYFKDDTLDNTGEFSLPRCIFTCKTLIEATLRCGRGVPSSGNVFLPCLKKLNLSHFTFEDNGSLSRLLAGCPVLEDLIIDWCEKELGKNGSDFVSSPSIKNLDVDVEYGCHKLKLNAPSLEYLNLRIFFLHDITSLTSMTSLIKARITLIGEWDGDVREKATVVQFLNSLCNVKCLKFSIEYVGKGGSLGCLADLGSMVKFDNLTKLVFDSLVDFDEIVKFLEVADNLQFFRFTLCGKHTTYRKPKQVPTCMLSSLKTVRITVSDGFNARDFKTIRYLLRNAQVLETMELRDYSYLCYKIKKERLGMLRRIPLLEKGSESCKLILY